MENKQICVLHTEWSEGWGGQEIRIINEILALQELGVKCFIACREHAKIKQKAIENGIEVFTLPFKGSADFGTIFKLMKLVKQNQIDIINTHSGKDTWTGGFAAKLSGVKFIRTRHISNKINPSKMNFINELADFVITTGKNVRETMIKDNRIEPEKILSIPTGADSTVFDPKNFNSLEAKKEFGFKDDEIIIGIIAILRGVKQHKLFLEVAKEVTNKIKDKKLKFIIAGDGPMKDEILANIKRLNLENNVQMLGHINDITKLLSAIDISMLVSRNEGVPQSLIQSLLMQKACISTNVGSVKDLWKDNNFLLVQNSQNEIQNALISLLENPSLKQELESKARGYMLENFSKDVMRDKIYDIYKKILNR